MNNITYYWINMDTATNRKEFMENQFNELSLKNERISAITPVDLPRILQDKPPFFCGYSECKTNNAKDCPIEYAVLCSHLSAIKKGYLSGDDYFIVCEDDIKFPFNINFQEMINRLPPSFHAIQLMVISSGHTEYFYENFYKNNIDFITYTPITPSAAFYLMTREGAKQLLDLYINKQTNKFDFTNCNYLKLADVLIFQTTFTFVSTFPFCFPVIKFKSQIHEHHYNAHKDAYETIIKKMVEGKNTNKFILNYYPCEDLEKLFKS